ncbi:hypothetical protein CEXT_780681 [Caerostris extrusa]|uniref:Uncharacterized protein n=1 Tax=Caerostris extrusa TaxID=172846 RepID=A0AAV4TR80_CAEEX|nr:hypothetical protein CEXT_780681 [Caerostris extrusa]
MEVGFMSAPAYRWSSLTFSLRKAKEKFRVRKNAKTFSQQNQIFSAVDFSWSQGSRFYVRPGLSPELSDFFALKNNLYTVCARLQPIGIYGTHSKNCCLPFFGIQGDIPAISWDKFKARELNNSQKNKDMAKIEKSIEQIESFTGWKQQEYESTLMEQN